MTKLVDRDGVNIPVTLDELQILRYAVAAFVNLTEQVPIIEGVATRSGKMKARRALDRVNEKINAIATMQGLGDL